MSRDRRQRTSAYAPARLFLAYVALIWATLPLLPCVVGWVRSHAGSLPIAIITPAGAILAAILLLRIQVRGGCHSRARWVLPGVATVAAAILLILRKNPVEQIHLLEYGLLGYLGLRAAREGNFPGKGRVVFWGLAVPLAGLADEVIQGFLPNRVFDWRDVGVNALSGFLGMLVSVSLRGRFDPPCGGGV